MELKREIEMVDRAESEPVRNKPDAVQEGVANAGLKRSQQVGTRVVVTEEGRGDAGRTGAHPTSSLQDEDADPGMRQAQPIVTHSIFLPSGVSRGGLSGADALPNAAFGKPDLE